MVSVDLYKSKGMIEFESLAKELLNFNFFEGSDLLYPCTFIHHPMRIFK